MESNKKLCKRVANKMVRIVGKDYPIKRRYCEDEELLRFFEGDIAPEPDTKQVLIELLEEGKSLEAHQILFCMSDLERYEFLGYLMGTYQDTAGELKRCKEKVCSLTNEVFELRRR